MSKGFLFFCCACVILLFSIINLSIGPIVSRTVGTDWGTLNCKVLVDDYDDAKKNGGLDDDTKKYIHQWRIDRCQRRKAMHDMEYTSFIFDVVIGFVCGLLGLLHYFGLKPDFVSKTGLIGLGCGVVGFVLTFVYVILNGLVYTNYYDSVIYKRDGDGAFAEKEGNAYKCIYFDKAANVYALYAKYSDLIQKQYNYNHDLSKDYKKDEYRNCISDPDDCENVVNGIIRSNDIPTYGSGIQCPKLYAPLQSGVANKDKSDRFLAALILSLLVCLASIGLALFGFLLWRNPEFSSNAQPSQSGVVPVAASSA